ncbi:MAG: hypothetical protein J5626_07845 [Lachnospiraceae bacterium]|nr:hypothetical protein [Lachnospiraceae bacterium]
MKKTPVNKFACIICLICGVLLSLAGCLFAFKMGFFREKSELDKSPCGIEVYIGDNSIADYAIVQKSGLNGAAAELSDYIYRVSGQKLKTRLKFKDGEKYIAVSKDKNLRSYDSHILINDGNVIIRGASDEECVKAVREFANLYLGLSFAGEDREHVLSSAGEAIRIPANVYECAEPWMPEREPIICLWKTNMTRGAYYNAATSLKSEVLSYSDDMLYAYVKMMRDCGFTGIQVTDMCSAWAAYGNYEFVHDRLRFMADAAHSLGMKFTLWVWGAEFTGYGWEDESVEYYEDDGEVYEYAKDNPAAQASFDKYYSIYAELADCTDRVIAHYFDPGWLTKQEDIAYYARTLREKFRAVNPKVDFGIETFTDLIDLRVMASELGDDFTMYSGTATLADNAWAGFRNTAKELELGYGVWSWNLVEMEIDQLAEMNVNSKVIKDIYLKTAANDAIYKPTYWSEMESYHVVNVFSLYVAGRLLQNLDGDSAEALKDAAVAVVGPEYANKLYEVLTLIEDARSGDSFESFKWSADNDDYIFYSQNYHPAEIYYRAEKALEYLAEMTEADIKCNTISLPVSVSELLELVKPHVRQIQEFAYFRMKYDDLYMKPLDAVTTEDVEAIYVPVCEYNVVTGLWGQPEARAQYELIEKLCAERNIDVPHNKVFDYYRKQRIYAELVTYQQKAQKCVYFDKETCFQFGAAISHEECRRLVEELVEEGILTENSDGKVYITDWRRYSPTY